MRNLGTKSNHLTLQEATTLTRKSSKTDKFSATKTSFSNNLFKESRIFKSQILSNKNMPYLLESP